MNFQVKKAELDDAESIVPLFDACRVFYEQDSNLSLAKEFIAERLKNNESTIFYATSDSNESMGFVQLYQFFSSVSAKRSWLLNDLRPLQNTPSIFK